MAEVNIDPRLVRVGDLLLELLDEEAGGDQREMAALLRHHAVAAEVYDDPAEHPYVEAQLRQRRFIYYFQPAPQPRNRRKVFDGARRLSEL